MIDGRQLWKARFARYMQETRRYLRYMLNPHLLFVLLVAIGAGAFVYQRWVNALSPQFPYEAIAAVALSLAVTHSPVRTLFQEADLVFLLPAEHRLGAYIRRAFLFSLGVQGYALVIVLLVIAPLHLKFSSWPLWQLGIALLLAKSWNMWSSWHEHYIAGARPHYLGIIVRFCLNAAWVYLALADASVLFLLSIWLIMGLLSVYFMRTTKGKPLPWELLIRNEEKAKLAFYRLANVFTDVPYLKQRAKRRKWLDFGLVFISWHQRSAFDYLYARTFFRAGDYFGLYMRLTALGCLFMYMIPFNYGKIGAALLFLYATHLQLLTFVHHHRSQLFVKLYPLPDGVQKQAAFRLLFILSLVQNALFSLFLAVLGDWKTAALLLGAGTMLSYWLLWIYFCRRGRIQA